MGRKAQNIASATELVTLSVEDAAELLRLSVEDATVIVGSGCRVSAAWLEEYKNRSGQLDLTMMDCSMLTGIPRDTLNRWRNRGWLKVRALSKSRTDKLLIPPAELVRTLRVVASERNGITAISETPSQFTKRAERDGDDALRACGLAQD